MTTYVYRTFDNRILAIRDGKFAYWVTGDSNDDHQLWIFLVEEKRLV